MIAVLAHTGINIRGSSRRVSSKNDDGTNYNGIGFPKKSSPTSTGGLIHKS